MEKSYSESYAAAGVDITAGYRSVELMKQYVARTMNEHCIGGLGGFGGLFELDCTGYKHPVLISGTDGVGTKLKLAMLLNKHDTIGIDCVAMCVNDVICCGARPLFFLDYVAIGHIEAEHMAKIIKVLNHNALIVHDAQSSRALLLLGKGIGFGRRINEQLEIGKAEGCSVYELQQKTSKGETRDVLRSMDPLYLEISAEIVELAEREFGEIDRNILVPLADHIAFALQDEHHQSVFQRYPIAVSQGI